MPSIKFSHAYPKLRAAEPTKTGTLLDVLNVRLEDLSPAFLEYDTTHQDGRYDLPKKGEYMLLLFAGPGGIFPTLRRRTPEKERYYRSCVGEAFEVALP